MDISKIKSLLPPRIYNELADIMVKFKIDNPLRLAHFLGQAAHESQNFIKLEENMNYSADRLLVIFPKYFNTNTAIEYAHKPEKIASKVYANRYGNGDEKSGDGWKYRGRGTLHLTFKDNYRVFSQFLPKGIDVVKNPELVAQTFALTSGAWFFQRNNLNSAADKGVSLGVTTIITKSIQGGTLDVNKRHALVTKFYNLLK